MHVERSLTPGNGRGHPRTSPAAENIRGNSQTNYVHEEISCTVKTMKCWSVAGRELQKVENDGDWKEKNRMNPDWGRFRKRIQQLRHKPAHHACRSRCPMGGSTASSPVTSGYPEHLGRGWWCSKARLTSTQSALEKSSVCSGRTPAVADSSVLRREKTSLQSRALPAELAESWSKSLLSALRVKPARCSSLTRCVRLQNLFKRSLWR